MKKASVQLTVLVLAMFAHEGVSIYAECVKPPPIDVEFNQSAAVFRGKVRSLEPLDNYSSIATFEWTTNGGRAIAPLPLRLSRVAESLQQV